MATLEGDEPGAAGARDGFGAGRAALGKEIAEAGCAVGLVVLRGELLAGEHDVAVGAGEALAVPGLVLERHSARRHDLLALGALGGELLLEAAHAVHVVVVGDDEGLGADERLADGALEALVVPLAVLVLHLFHARAEGVAAGVAPRGELFVVARAAEDVGVLGGEGLRHQRSLAPLAAEAVLKVTEFCESSAGNFRTLRCLQT